MAAKNQGTTQGRDASQSSRPWAVVTGASSGIGAAIAGRLAECDYNILAVARREAVLSDLAERLHRDHGVLTQTLVQDLRAPDASERIFAASQPLRVEALVSCAGAERMGAVLAVDLAMLRDALRVNAQVHLELAHQFGRRFARQGSGRILLVSSLAGLQGTPYAGNYSGAKAYVLNLGMAMNYELSGSGVTATVLVPGPTDTPGLTAQADIPLATLPAPQMRAERVARVAVAAMERGQPMVVPGLMNRAMVHMGRAMGPRLSRNMWGMLMGSVMPEYLKTTEQEPGAPQAS